MRLPVQLVSATVLTVLCATRLAAQQRSSTDLFIATGPQLRGVYWNTGGHTFHGGVVRQAGSLGLRLGVQYSSTPFVHGAGTGTPVFTHERLAAATFELTWDVTRTRLRPYLVGGWWLTWAETQGAAQFRNSNSTAALLAGGAGLRYRIGDASLFIESRFSSPAGYVSPIMPVTFGIRFDD